MVSLDDSKHVDVLRYNESRLPLFLLLCQHLRVECELMLHDAPRPGGALSSSRCPRGSDAPADAGDAVAGTSGTTATGMSKRELVSTAILPHIFFLYENMTGILAYAQEEHESGNDLAKDSYDLPDENMVRRLPLWLTHSLTRSLTGALTHSLTGARTHWRTHR